VEAKGGVPVLQITEAAESALRRIHQQNAVPGATAIRIGAVQRPGGGVGIGFAFTDGPEDGDETISDKEDFVVYLSQELVGPFREAALEATSDQDGITLELRTQAQLRDHQGADLE
jgi:Fe-S cluster assembly iron-binding protein IscA